MGQNAQLGQTHRGLVTIDWMVLAVACITLLFLLGSMLRTSVDADALHSEGFRELRGDDRLLAFQDFSFDAAGWNPADTSDRLPGQGPVLGPFSAEPVQRSFAMPTDATSVQVTFDLHLIGPWAGEGEFHVSLGQDEVLTIGLPEAEGGGPDALDMTASQTDGLRVIARRSAVSPRAAEATLPGTDDDFVTLRIGLELLRPPETLTLRLMAEVDGDAQWTLDNLTAVATAGDGIASR